MARETTSSPAAMVAYSVRQTAAGKSMAVADGPASTGFPMPSPRTVRRRMRIVTAVHSPDPKRGSTEISPPETAAFFDPKLSIASAAVDSAEVAGSTEEVAAAESRWRRFVGSFLFFAISDKLFETSSN